MDNELSRRDLIKLAAAATVAASLGVADAATAAQTFTPAFFSAEELALVDELSEMIIPTDAHAPGARAAKVAAFLDGQLNEAWDPSDKTQWRDGLALVERLSHEANGRSFLESPPEARLAILTRMARNEGAPQQPEERFFVELKARVVHAYYTSEIGIKQEMEYTGNSYLTEFVGTDVS